MSEHFSVFGFDDFQSDWKRYDMLQGKKIKCTDLKILLRVRCSV